MNSSFWVDFGFWIWYVFRGSENGGSDLGCENFFNDTVFSVDGGGCVYFPGVVQDVFTKKGSGCETHSPPQKTDICYPGFYILEIAGRSTGNR